MLFGCLALSVVPAPANQALIQYTVFFESLSNIGTTSRHDSSSKAFGKCVPVALLRQSQETGVKGKQALG